jgi:hypothetical protein
MKDRFGIDWERVRSAQKSMPRGAPFWEKPQLGRRMFFRHMATAVGGYFLLPSRPMETIAKAAVTTRGTARNVIFILMAGAPSHTDTFDLKEGPWTPASFNPTSYGDIRFPQGLLPNLAEQMDSLVFVRSIVAWAVAHGVGQAWVQLGRNPLAGLSRISPHIGSVVAMELGPQDNNGRVLPAFLSLNSGGNDPQQGYFPGSTAPFYISPGGGGLGNTTHRDGAARLDTRYGLLQQLDTELRDNAPLGPAVAEMASLNVAARTMMYNSSVDNVFTFPAAERARYGNSGFGNACITARNLLQSGLGTRFIQITIGGWDNHVNIYQPNTALTPAATQFDTGLARLIADLKAAGLLDSTLILAMGEFGRTVGPLNAQNGRDHYLQQAALFAGGGIKGGGRAIGATDKVGGVTIDPGWSGDRPLKPEDIEATIYSALGIDWTTVRHDDPLGRGFEYVPSTEGLQFAPVDELWG